MFNGYLLIVGWFVVKGSAPYFWLLLIQKLGVKVEVAVKELDKEELGAHIEVRSREEVGKSNKGMRTKSRR